MLLDEKVRKKAAFPAPAGFLYFALFFSLSLSFVVVLLLCVSKNNDFIVDSLKLVFTIAAISPPIYTGLK